ncbi:hypothetical protein PROFUN_13009 [Planoprotostelium fungivorum]|uniref:Vacuolar protein sorting-associated protein 33A n=1 Tax=Planoprotostelium fungivorum TaxID=1890364 RepID=A0A2P6N5T5_9EUKA|nr:hypothetical protein PROFUN_13009 [Planoprotostelium fungivorum]
MKPAGRGQPPSGAAAGAGAPNAPAAAAASPYPTLSGSVINLSKMREEARRALIELLDSVKGKKVLVLDPKLSGPLGQVVEMALLKEHGVEKIYYVQSGRFSTDSRTIVYLIRPRVELAKRIAENIENHKNEGQSKEYHVFFVPRSTTICVTLLEEHGVDNVVTMGEYPLDLIPYDDDVLSLELDSSYRECFLEGDRSSLYYVARSIMKMQASFGIIPKITWKGNASRLVAEMLGRMRKEFEHELPNTSPDIDQLLIIDREVDLITPLLTQLTYEGLIDEIFGISNSFVEIDPNIIGAVAAKKDGPPVDPNRKHKVPLNSGDRVFSTLRDLNFNNVGPLLNKKAREIDEYYKQRHNNLTPPQLRDYMKKFAATQQEHLSSTTHTAVALHIQKVVRDPAFLSRLEAEVNLIGESNSIDDYIEECINKQEPLVKVLRLLCLTSLVNNGLKVKMHEFYRREIIQSYGFEHILTLDNLEQLGLLKRQEGKNTFPSVRKNLNVYSEDVNESEPKDINFAYSGYAPLSIRVIQNSFKPGWEVRDDLLGPQDRMTQTLNGSTDKLPNSTRNNVTLVYFVGGVTFAEISLLRWLSRQEGNLYGDFVVATTKLINGNSFLQSIMENMTPPPPPVQPKPSGKKK